MAIVSGSVFFAGAWSVRGFSENQSPVRVRKPVFRKTAGEVRVGQDFFCFLVPVSDAVNTEAVRTALIPELMRSRRLNHRPEVDIGSISRLDAGPKPVADGKTVIWVIFQIRT